MMLTENTHLTNIELSTLEQHEVTIERGLKTFVDVGNALLAIRDGRLYRQEYGTFEDYCQERWGMTRRNANRLILASETALALGPTGPIPQTERQIRPLTSLDPDVQREVWQTAVNTAPNGKPTAAHVEQTKREYLAPLWSADGESGDPEPYEDDEWTPPASKPHVANNSGNNEWYTPAEYIEAARAVLGTIDLDPASSETANSVVLARRIYTADDDGLQKPWRGRVWMNPPYSSDLIGRFSEKICQHYDSGEVESAIVLVNNATETAWFQVVAERASAICFPRGRVKFWKPGGELGQPLQGQAIMYLGDDPDAFRTAFKGIGFVCSL